MSFSTRIFIVNNIKLPINASFEEAFSVSKKKLSTLGIKTSDLIFSIFKKSIDARDKSNIFFVYSVAVSGNLPDISEEKLTKSGISAHEPTSLKIEEYGDKVSDPPLIVGSGPCGLFAALILAENGYNPILIERGGSVEERKKLVERFNLFGILDPDTNIQFGAGGAGTFSDGKLVTRINDPLSAYVFKALVRFGAPEEILYLARPHVGTDVLSCVIENVIKEIERLGGTVKYHTKFLRAEERDGRRIAHTNNGDIPFGALILAVGHSARDTYRELINDGYTLEGKPFSVGMRIEHKAIDIDKSMYGNNAGNPLLGHAEYNLSHNTKERGVYTFCMCPGGEVVAAASETGHVVVNGMSKHARDGENSNSAVVCSIFKEDYGNSPIKAIEFQENIERLAFKKGGGDYSAPMITVGDFLSDTCINEPSYVIPTYMDGKRTRLCRPEEFLPRLATESIKNALLNFDKKIKGFASSKAVLTGAETRTSAPIRILRDPDTRLAVGSKYLYPAGEGAGYAGGITSAAIDGIKTAIAVIKEYKPKSR